MNAGRSKRGVSRFRGVSIYHGRGGWTTWRARLTVNGKELVRYSRTEEGAAMLYNEMATKHFGSYARLNEVPR